MSPTAPAEAPSVAPVPETTPPAERGRDPWLDNAKMALVTLVVVGHMWTLLPEPALNRTLYDFLYLWHIPAFVLVTGYLSRSFTWTPRNLRQLVTSVAVPYLLFEGALAAFRVYVGGEELNAIFADPHWPMWYLAVLFVWRLATPALLRVPHAVAVAVVLCLLGGLATGDTLDWARALGLLPFFVVGLLVRPDQLELLRRPATRSFAAAALVAALAVSAVVQDRVVTEWLYWRSSYGELDAPVVEGVVTRLLLVGAGLLLAACFLSLVPRRGGWFSRLGAATLVVYLFHAFVLLGLEYAGLPGWAAANPVLSLVVATPAAVALALLLAWPPVSRRLGVLVDPLRRLPRTPSWRTHRR